ncbi:MAG: hypothetical protein PHT32_07510, partial [Candidatus Omnitrophica bacterium]|nr:hypothetical protein [Candidatus Omnitrophota bacterium]
VNGFAGERVNGFAGERVNGFAGERVNGLRGTRDDTSIDDVIVESPIDGMIEYLAEQTLLNKLVEVFEESKLSEFAARAIHLEKSTRDLTDKEKHLKLKFFHAYHEIIDKGTRELFSTQIIRRKAE